MKEIDRNLYASPGDSDEDIRKKRNRRKFLAQKLAGKRFNRPSKFWRDTQIIPQTREVEER